MAPTCERKAAAVSRSPSPPALCWSAATCIKSLVLSPWLRGRLRIGTIIAPSSSIDFVVLGLAIFVGSVIGVPATFAIGNLKISLGTSIGTLLAGLVVGHIRYSGGFPRRRRF